MKMIVTLQVVMCFALLCVFGCGGHKIEIAGEYSTLSHPKTSMDGLMKWRFGKEGDLTVGDLKSSTSIIKGTWTLKSDSQVDVQFLSIGGRDIAKEPKTSDTRLSWTFSVVGGNERQPMELISDDKKISLVDRKPL